MTVLIHLDQHFIERGPCRSERERTLEILDFGHIVRWLSLPPPFDLIRTAQGHMLPSLYYLRSSRRCVRLTAQVAIRCLITGCFY
jgi:hypothetical protein